MIEYLCRPARLTTWDNLWPLSVCHWQVKHISLSSSSNRVFRHSQSWVSGKDSSAGRKAGQAGGGVLFQARFWNNFISSREFVLAALKPARLHSCLCSDCLAVLHSRPALRLGRLSFQAQSLLCDAAVLTADGQHGCCSQTLRPFCFEVTVQQLLYF